MGGYVRTSWADLCREIGKLDLAPKPRATVHALALASTSSDAPESPEHGAEHGEDAEDAAKGLENRPEGWALQDLKEREPRDRRAFST